MKRILVVIVVVVLLLMVLPLVCQAQGEFNVKVFPAKIELPADPGTTVNFEINVRNEGSEDLLLNVYFMDYYIKPDNEFVFQEPGHYSYSCATWLSTETPELPVTAGQLATKSFTMTVPPEAEPGGHFGVIFFEQIPLEGGSPVRFRPRIGSLVLATVPGEVIREGEIESVSVTSTWFWPSRKYFILPRKTVTVRVVVRNTGNVHLTMKAKVTYEPTFGWGSGAIEFKEITVLPDTERYFDAELPNPPLLGSYKVTAEIFYGPSLEVFDTTKEMTGSFSSYPISLLLILAGLICVVVGIFLLLKRKRRGRSKETTEAVEEEPDGGEEAGGVGADSE